MGRFAVGVLVFCFAGGALAQAAEEDGARIGLGAGVVNAPKYPGADEYRVRVIPVVSLSFGRFFVGGVRAGAGAPRAARWG